MENGLKRVSDYFSLVKINHTVFSLPFAFIGFSLGVHDSSAFLSIRLLILVFLCVFFARNAAMGFNRYADREIDGKNPRTAFREIPREIIKPGSAMWFVVINGLLFMTVTWFINLLCFILSPVALMVVLGYSYTKRFTFLSHVFLGMGLALAPVGAYLAVTAHFALVPVIYSVIVVFWVAGFDILYALQDIEFDQSQSLHSIPESFGKVNALIISALFHFIAVILVVVAGLAGDFHTLYWIGAAVFASILLYEHLIVKPGDISKVNLAFATMNGMASILYAVFVIADIFTR
jgi:4-hydroxybenzoate polyprenyltransferase